MTDSVDQTLNITSYVAAQDGSIRTDQPLGPPIIPGNPMLDFNFDSYSSGADLANNPFSSGVRTLATSSQSFSPPNSANIEFIAGGTAGGAQKNLDNSLGEGDELWVRFRARFDVGFLFNAGAGFKFLRSRIETDTGAHLGYLDWYNASDRYAGNAWYYRNEPRAGQNTEFGDFSTQNIDAGNWHTYEMYIKLHSNPAEGIIRAWRDGGIMLNIADNTLQSSTGRLSRFHLCTFFNPSPSGESFNPADSSVAVNANAASGAPQQQSYQVDDLLVFTNASPPTNTDAGGNVFIGA